MISDYNGIDHIDPRRPRRPVRRSRWRPGVNAGIDMFMQPSNFEAFESTLTALVQRRHRPDGAHRRRGVADPDREVRARALRAPLHRPHPPVRGRRRGPPRASRAGRSRESQVLLQERPAHPAALAAVSTVYVAGSNADNIGNQAGGWTLTWQGGSTNVIPGHDDPRGHPAVGRLRQRHLQRGRLDAGAARTPSASWSSARRRTPRASATCSARSGPTTRATTDVPRPVKDMQISTRDTAAVNKVCAAGQAVRRRGRLGSAADHRSPSDARRDRRDRRGLAARAARAKAWRTTLFGRAPYTGKLPVTWPRTLSARSRSTSATRTTTRCIPFGFGLTTHVGRSHGGRS